MTVPTTIVKDAESVHRALEREGDQVRLAVSRETAELIARVVDARAQGQQILVTRGAAEVSPNEVAELLGISRPQVRKLMERGLLEFRKVGTHHRIRLASVQGFLDVERAHRNTSLEELADLQNELGLIE